MCCLKRPFDDQSQARIRLESEAVLALLDAPPSKIEFLRTAALDLENEQNPMRQRAANVRLWLEGVPAVHPPDDALADRVRELSSVGFKSFDALHVASAEILSADAFCTCDDKLVATARQHATQLKVRVTGPIDLAREVL